MKSYMHLLNRNQLNIYIKLLRRRYYVHFRRKYVLDSLKKRKGKCKRCTCCEANIFCTKYKCKHYDKKNKSCRLYNTPEMPKTCYYYPFDEKDKWDEFRDNCGFYWGTKKK